MPTKLERLVEAQMRFEEMHFLFMGSEIARVDTVLAKLDADQKNRYASKVEDFDRFFAVLLKYKEAAGIINSSTALLAICDIVETWLEEQAALAAQAAADDC
jgi:hypothetical protein